MNKISEKMNFNLFGEKVEKNPLLRDKFIEPPFSVLDTKGANWQKRKRQWKTLGIRSEIGRDAKAYNMSDWLDTKAKKGQTNLSDTSIFDPALCEVLYHWFCEKNGSILDPFAGGSVRGIVAHYLNYKYTGIELRPEQVHSNRIQAKDILNPNNQPKWITGDSNKELDSLDNQYDFVFSCPPYADLEVYSDLEGDISNMPYNEFLTAYNSIIDKSCK